MRELFDLLEREIRRIGEVHVYAQKSRIVFQTRGRFVAVQPRKDHLAGHVWLKRRREHPIVVRVEPLLGRDFVHHFRLRRPEDLDPGFCELLREGYAVGSQTFEAARSGR